MRKALSKMIRSQQDSVISQFDFTLAPAVKTAAHDTGFAILHVKTGNVHLCCGIAAKIWSGVIVGESISQIADKVSCEYSIPKDQASSYVNAFVRNLIRRKIIVRKRAMCIRSSDSVLFALAMWALLVYDLRIWLFGFHSVHKVLERCPCRAIPSAISQQDLIKRVLRAVSLAASLYWRPVHCLQWSVVATRLLRAWGIPAQLAIGYRVAPFFSHAWVEVDGRVVNDSTALPHRLTVLHRV